MASRFQMFLTIQRLERELSHFKRTTEQLNEKCDQLITERDQMTSLLDDLSLKCDGLIGQRDTLRNRIDGLSECYETLELERDQLDAVCRERGRLLEDKAA